MGVMVGDGYFDAENKEEGGRSADGGERRCPFFFSSRRRHTRLQGDWSSDVCSSDLGRSAPGADWAGMADLAQLASPGSDDERQLRRIDLDRLPRHVAVIMDGNGRWARKDRKSVV